MSRPWSFRRVIMGVEAKVIIYSESEEVAGQHAAAVFTRLGELDARFSDYRRDSELNQLCAAPCGVPHHVSDELFFVLALAQRISERSAGAFDISLGPATSLWRTARKSGSLASNNELADAVARTGWRKIVLDRESHAVTLAQARMQLDLGGIAKGYAVADGVGFLAERGAACSLVALAGDIAVGDAPPGELGWRISTGSDSGIDPVCGVLLAANASVSTSGDTQQFVEIGGHRYAHIIDPRTGLGAQHVRAVTVVVPHDARGRAVCGGTADAIATALSLLDDEQAAALIAAPAVAPAAASIRDLTKAGAIAIVVGDRGLFRWAPAQSDPAASGVR